MAEVRSLRTYHKFKGLRLNCDTCGAKLEDERHPHLYRASGFRLPNTQEHCLCGNPNTDAIHHQADHMQLRHPRLCGGMTGNLVQIAQGLLMEALGETWGYGSIVVFDATLTARVKRFQRDVALEPDGIIGPRTWSSLTDVAASNRASVAQRKLEDMNKSAVFTGKGVPDWYKDTLPPGTPASEMTKMYEEYLRQNAEPRFKGVRNGQSQFDVAIMCETPHGSWELVPGGNMAVAWGTDQPNVRQTARAMIYEAAKYADNESDRVFAQDLSYAWYDVFAERIVSKLPLQGWDMTFDTVLQVINAYEEASANGTGPKPRNNTGSGASSDRATRAAG